MLGVALGYCLVPLQAGWPKVTGMVTQTAKRVRTETQRREICRRREVKMYLFCGRVVVESLNGRPENFLGSMM